MNIINLKAAVRGVLRDREIARLMPVPVSNKTEPKVSPAQRLLAAKQAARRGA